MLQQDIEPLQSPQDQSDWLTYLLRDNPDLYKTPGVAAALSAHGYANPNPMAVPDAVAGFTQATQYMRRLQSLNKIQQYQAYHTLPPTQRAALLNMGYRLDVTPEEVMGWEKQGLVGDNQAQYASGIGGVLGKAVGKAFHWIGSGIGEVTKPISAALNPIIQGTGHVFRAVELGALTNKRGEHEYYTPEGWMHMDSAGFGGAWNMTKNGNAMLVDPGRIQSDLDPDLKNVLMDRAVGVSDEDLVKKYGIKNWSAAIDPENDQATHYMQALEDSKLGGGRGVARAIGIQEGSKDFKVASGLVDGGMNLLIFDAGASGLGAGLRAVRNSEKVADIPGVFGEALRAAPRDAIGTQRLTRMVNNGATVRQAFDSVPQVRRAMGFIADTKDATGRVNIGKVMQAFPHLNEDILAAGARANPETAADVRDVFVGAADKIAHANAKAIESGLIDLPTMTKLGESIRVPLKVGASDWLDRMADRPEKIEGFPDISKQLVQPFARAIRGTLHQDLPTNMKRLNVADDKSIKSYEKMLSFGSLNPEVKNLFLTDYAAADPIGRANILASTYQTAVEGALRMYGRTLSDTPMLQKNIGDMMESLERLKASNGVPLMDANGNLVNELEDGIGNITRARGQTFLSEGQTWDMPVPRFSEIVKGIHATNFLHMPENTLDFLAEHPTKLLTNYKSMFQSISDLEGGFINNIWRPMVLMHLGFPLRVALEEGLREMLQHGFMNPIQGYFADGEIRNRIKAEAAYTRKFSAERGAVKHLADTISLYTHAAFSATEKSLLPESINTFATWQANNGGEHIPSQIRSEERRVG